MTDLNDQRPETDANEAKLERLRDRTDEIELIISGLTTVALFTLPGWLFETLTSVFSHNSIVTAVGSNILLTLVPGLFYVLGTCFAVHLMVRAYWAGLIGLRTVFPKGIDWDRTPGFGPLSREHYREHLPDLAQAITRADHFASSLFSVISMMALGVLWISLIMAIVLVPAGIIGTRTGQGNQAITIASYVMVGVLVGLPALLWFLDKLLGRWPGRLTESGFYRRTVRGLIRANGWIWPQRLILPVQLTLQSNTRPRLFGALIAFGVILILFVGGVRYQSWTEFSVTNAFPYLDDETVSEGFRSTYYENLRSRRDRVRLFPMIDQFVQERSVLTVFLPYQPIRDDLVAAGHCPEQEPSVDCLQQIWRVTLGDRTLAPEELLPAQRFDLNLRGLIGVLPLSGLEPGLHTLEVVWNPDSEVAAVALDDRYSTPTRNYQIPFVFAPAYELGLDQAQPQTP